MKRSFVAAALILALGGLTGGCIERILTIQTDPPGALVELNAQEMGRTPVSRDFTWYGTYDVTLRLDNYRTLKTTAKVFAPIYEWIPLDLVTELLPLPFKDHHTIHYTLMTEPPASEPNAGILERAEELKGRMETTHYPSTRKSR